MTSKNIVGDCKAIDWHTHGKTYPHLTKIPFSQPTKQGQIELLIGLDHPYLHEAIQEIKGDLASDPITRLTPLGWTYIGKTKTIRKVRIRSNIKKTVHVCRQPTRHYGEKQDFKKILGN